MTSRSSSGSRNIAAVPHGFRSSFRDWAAERTDHPREVIETALRRPRGRIRPEAAVRERRVIEP